MRPGIAILHAATAVSNGSQGRLVSDQSTGLEQRSGVSVRQLGDDGDHHHTRGGGSVRILDVGRFWLLLSFG